MWNDSDPRHDPSCSLVSGGMSEISSEAFQAVIAFSTFSWMGFVNMRKLEPSFTRTRSSAVWLSQVLDVEPLASCLLRLASRFESIGLAFNLEVGR